MQDLFVQLSRQGQCSQQSLQLIDEMSNHDVDAMLSNSTPDHEMGEVVEEIGQESMVIESTQQELVDRITTVYSQRMMKLISITR